MSILSPSSTVRSIPDLNASFSSVYNALSIPINDDFDDFDDDEHYDEPDLSESGVYENL